MSSQGFVLHRDIQHQLRTRLHWACTQCGWEATGREAVVFPYWRESAGEWWFSVTCGECSHYVHRPLSSVRLGVLPPAPHIANAYQKGGD